MLANQFFQGLMSFRVTSGLIAAPPPKYPVRPHLDQHDYRGSESRDWLMKGKMTPMSDPTNRRRRTNQA
jgi:hypothetical protein